MKRRNFLKLLSLTPLVPITISKADVPKEVSKEVRMLGGRRMEIRFKKERKFKV